MRIVMKHTVMTVYYSIILLSVLNAAVAAAATGDVAVEVENKVIIEHGNSALARREAVQGALERAVRQVTATLVKKEPLQQHDQILQKSIYLLSDHYIKDYRLIDEKIEAGMYVLAARVTVYRDMIKAELETLGLWTEPASGIVSAPVIVVISGIKRYQSYEMLQNLIKSLKGVKRVEQRSIAWETARMEVTIQGGAAVLATELAKLKQVALITNVTGENTVEVTFVR